MNLKARWRWGCVGVAGAVTVAVAGACASPPPDNSPDPCAILSTECPYCTLPGPKETCENAVATSDDVQCTVALDDQDVVANCVASDGGSDGGVDAPADAPPLPLCDAAQVLPDAACSCVAPCVVTCPAGGCTIDCPKGATCLGSCSGGSCVFGCPAGSTCTDSCEGGGCAFQCQNDSVCNDTCATTPPCTGP
ncbi:MAG TPA: hypothetical protein VGL81_21350 [Polyangiaceae bacterium]|jgi:hypothetical protein